jgi:hypothetical protein
MQPSRHACRHSLVKTARMRSSSILCAVVVGAAVTAAACTSPPTTSPVHVSTAISDPVAPRPLDSSSAVLSLVTTVGSKTSPSDLACASSTEIKINAPLAAYGELDSATLNFSAGRPPAAAFCATFTSSGPRQTGSTTSTSGPLMYLFSQNNPTKVSSGGGYYWIAGAVDATVASVALTPHETKTPLTVDLVPLAVGWRGFVFEYSPGPFQSAPPTDAGVTVSAVDKNGETLDSRHVDVETGAVQRIRPTAVQPQQTH